MTTTINADNITGGAIVTGDSSGVLALQTAGTTAVTITSAQNVGIGTTSPAAFGAGYTTLTVQGSSSGFVQATNGTITTEAGTYSGTGYTGTRTNHPYAFVVNGSEKFRVDTAGQLGIGGANYGTSGQVLTSAGSGSAPTWSTPSAGAMTLISQTNITNGTTSVSVSIPSTYNGVYFVVSALTNPAATYGRLQITMNNNTSAVYHGGWYQGSSANFIDGATSITLGVGGPSGSTQAQCSIAVGTLYSLQSSSYKNMAFQFFEGLNNSTFNGMGVGGVTMTSTSTITSIQFKTADSWQSGQIFVYGIT